MGAKTCCPRKVFPPWGLTQWAAAVGVYLIPYGSECGTSLLPCRSPWHHGLRVVRRGCLRGALLSALPQRVPGHPVQVWLVLLAWHGGVTWLLLVRVPAHLLHVSLQR